MKKWGASLLAIGGAALTILTPDIQALISAHPKVSVGLTLAYSILTHLLPSPTQPPKDGQ